MAEFSETTQDQEFPLGVSGPHFRGYRLMFDGHAAQILGITDLIAERVRKNGHRTLTSIGDIAGRQSIAENDDVKVPAADMLEELRSDNLKLVVKLREAKELASDAGDNATDGLLDDWTDRAEERALFLLEIAQKG